jgi:uncharacterized protein involved in cysteine biosynthesis
VTLDVFCLFDEAVAFEFELVFSLLEEVHFFLEFLEAVLQGVRIVRVEIRASGMGLSQDCHLLAVVGEPYAEVVVASMGDGLLILGHRVAPVLHIDRLLFVFYCCLSVVGIIVTPLNSLLPCLVELGLYGRKIAPITD